MLSLPGNFFICRDVIYYVSTSIKSNFYQIIKNGKKSRIESS